MHERASRLTQGHRSEYPSLWLAIEFITVKSGGSAQTLLTGSSGMKSTVHSAKRRHQQTRTDTELGAGNRKLRHARDVLPTANAFSRRRPGKEPRGDRFGFHMRDMSSRMGVVDLIFFLCRSARGGCHIVVSAPAQKARQGQREMGVSGLTIHLRARRLRLQRLIAAVCLEGRINLAELHAADI